MTLQDILRRRGVPFRVSSGDQAKVHVCCVFCTGKGKGVDTQYRLCLHSKLGWGRCVHCEWKSSRAIVNFLKALRIAEVPTGFEAKQESAVIERAELPADFRLLSDPIDDLDRRAKDYLSKRGVSDLQMRRHRVGVSYVGRYAYRILFTAYDKGELVSVNARDFTGRKIPKYLNSRGDKGIFAFEPSAKQVVLCEGAIKALRVRRSMPVSAGALLGSTLTDRQLAQISAGACEEIVLYPDPDAPGLAGVIKIADKLRENWGGGVKIAWPVKLPADEADPRDIRDAVKSSVEYSRLLGVQLRVAQRAG